MRANEEELRQEREDNVRGLPPKDRTMVRAPVCRGCMEKRLAVCICCLNFPVCEDSSGKPGCWVSEKCAGCAEK